MEKKNQFKRTLTDLSKFLSDIIKNIKNPTVKKMKKKSIPKSENPFKTLSKFQIACIVAITILVIYSIYLHRLLLKNDRILFNNYVNHYHHLNDHSHEVHNFERRSFQLFPNVTDNHIHIWEDWIHYHPKDAKTIESR